jgi:acetolactate synthase-1/2/3 large subunit
MAAMNGGKLIVRTLMAAGVETIFGLHGAHIDTVFQAALDCGLQIVDTRHEVAAGHAAEGYARAGRRLGVALVTAGGGFTNVLTSIANASFDRTPVLYIAGSGALTDDETNTLQAGFDQVAMARPVTKWAHRITVASNIPRLLEQAMRIALAAPRGPVLIDIPWDVLRTEVPDGDVESAAPARLLARAAPLRSAMEQALDLLAAANRPVIVAGSEVVRADASASLQEFAACTGIPVFSDYEGLAALGHSSLSAGLLQGLYTLGERPDAVLMLGLRWGLMTGHGSGLLIPRTAQVVQVDADAREIGRLQPVALGIVADPGEAVRSLAEAARRRAWPDWTSWRRLVRQTIDERLRTVSAGAVDAMPMHPFRATLEVAAAVTPETIVCADGALTYLWLSEAISAAHPAAFLCHGTFGSMGVGMGIAVGAQVAWPGKRVILVTGDGSVGYALGEFDTMVRHELPVVVIVMNNRSWGATLHFQQMVAGADRVTKTRLENGAYHEVAIALGGRGVCISRPEEIGPAIEAAFASGVATCIDISIGLDAIPPEESILMGENPFTIEECQSR